MCVVSCARSSLSKCSCMGSLSGPCPPQISHLLNGEALQVLCYFIPSQISTVLLCSVYTQTQLYLITGCFFSSDSEAHLGTMQNKTKQNKTKQNKKKPFPESCVLPCALTSALMGAILLVHCSPCPGLCLLVRTHSCPTGLVSLPHRWAQPSPLCPGLLLTSGATGLEWGGEGKEATTLGRAHPSPGPPTQA